MKPLVTYPIEEEPVCDQGMKSSGNTLKRVHKYSDVEVVAVAKRMLLSNLLWN